MKFIMISQFNSLLCTLIFLTFLSQNTLVFASSLFISTTPNNAKVFINEIFYGYSPIYVQNLNSNDISVRAEKFGFISTYSNTEIMEGRNNKIHLGFSRPGWKNQILQKAVGINITAHNGTVPLVEILIRIANINGYLIEFSNPKMLNLPVYFNINQTDNLNDALETILSQTNCDFYLVDNCIFITQAEYGLNENPDILYKIGKEFLSNNRIQEGLSLVDKAARFGNVDAQVFLGTLEYEKAEKSGNYFDVIKWWIGAAEKGDVVAQHNLGVLYTHGKGLDVSWEQALFWFEKAANQGYSHSQFVLGSHHYLTIGEDTDEVEGKKWLKMAAAQGHSAALSMLGSIEEKNVNVSNNNCIIPADLIYFKPNTSCVYNIHRHNRRIMYSWNILEVNNGQFLVYDGFLKFPIPIEEISKIEVGVPRPRERRMTSFQRIYTYEQLLKLPFQQLHDMWIGIDESTNWRYACEIESALNFAAKHKAIDELEDATTVRSMLSASDDYAKAATKQRYNLYCE